ncbi:MAG: CHAT domain-containing protein [Stigonema ocellatum SAG 48.90 = DSM 106950]|nr:CHAT domain-containing protein [Stigonema ocellatum SAG 48.90 = DSM 106950]
MTQEFHISVTPVGQNDYLVRTEQVAPGVPLAEELVNWPVADWLTAAGHLMNDPLKSVLQGDVIARNSVNLVALGQQLYNALFQGTLRDSWITAQGIAQNHQQVLRLRLGLKDTRLARLPWEVMHFGDRPVATGAYIAFSRYQSGISGASRLPSTNMPVPLDEGGIRVLMAMASPTDQVRLSLLKQEAIKLQAELHYLEGGNYLPQIQLTLLEQPGREELTQALEQGRYHVLHYSGHSNLGPNGGEIYLVSSRTGLTETLSGDDLAGLLVNNNIQMAVFNSCLGAYAPTSDTIADTGERNLTESLVKRGIRSVLAMSERIPEDVALTLTQLFYRNLARGYAVDLCVSRMRQGLVTSYGAHQMYWALPILYLQPEFDGYLSPEIYLHQSMELLNEYDSTFRKTSTMYAAADDVDMPLPIEDIISSPLARDSSELDWLGEDTWGDLVDEIEYDDPTYAEDSAIVSDLFRQLDNSSSGTEQSHMTAELVEEVGEDNIYGREVLGDIGSQEGTLGMWTGVPTPAQYGRDNDASRRELPKGSEANGGEAENLSQNWENSDVSSLYSSTTPSQRAILRRRIRRNLGSIFGIVGLSAAAAIVGLNWWQNRQISIPDIPTLPEQSPSSPNSPQVNLKTDATGIVTAYATEKLSKGDLPDGLSAVEELLTRGALNNAQAALTLVSNSQANDPSVNFFKGRLAWQFVQTGEKKYSVDDARRYWESAVKAQPDSPLYTNALGFAYYAEGNLNRANESWFKALNLAVKQQSITSTNTAIASLPPPRHDALTAYAGLALGMYKTADSQPAAKREQYLKEAIKLRQMVVKDDPVNFQLNQLSKNWLWTDEAMRDWRSLLQLNSESRATAHQ